MPEPTPSTPVSTPPHSQAAADWPAPWGELAPRLGASLQADPWGAQARFPALAAEATRAGFVAAVPDLGLLSARGSETRKFLQSQLTNDVERLADDRARWFGYCTAKGRLLSTFLGWPEDDGFALVLARPSAEALRKKLSMFVLRAKTKISDASDSRVLFGLGGQAGAAALARLGFAEAPAPMAVARAGETTAIGLPAVEFGDAMLSRWLLCLQVDAAADAWQTLRDAGLAPASSDFWRWTEVRAAVPRIVPDTAELFVPQMINLDLSGGVSFTKGCYPGQEIVARTHYLGKQRRRMLVGHLDSPAPEPAPGSDVLDPGGAPAGRVVLAAPAPGGGIDLLFEARTDPNGEVALSAAGAEISIVPLPYELPE